MIDYKERIKQEARAREFALDKQQVLQSVIATEEERKKEEAKRLQLRA